MEVELYLSNYFTKSFLKSVPGILCTSKFAKKIDLIQLSATVKSEVSKKAVYDELLNES